MTTTTAKDLINAGSPWGDMEAAAEKAAIAEALNQEARDNWDVEAWHRQVAADLATSLDYGFRYENPFGQYLNVRNVGEFDRVIIRERRGLKVFYTSRGGYIEESQIRTEQWELPRDTLGFHVSEHIDKLRANFAETLEDLAGLGRQRLEAEVNRRMLQLLQEAIPSGHASYVTNATLTKAILDDAIRGVADAIRPTGQGPVPITIMGRAAVVDAIGDIVVAAGGVFNPEAAEELRQRGRLGVYRGAAIQQLVNYTDEDDLPFIPANELWVFGGNVGQFAMYGGLLVKTWEENTVDYRHYRARRDIGGMVHRPEQARRIVITGITP